MGPKVDDAQERYADARDRAIAARKAWHDAGGPLTDELPNGIVRPHPLLKVLQDAEKHADSLMKSLGSRASKGGRPVGAQSAPDREAPPRRAPLKVVK